MDADTIHSVNAAIRNKDLVELVRMLDLQPDMWGSGSKLFHKAQRNETITLLRKLTTEGFGIGLQSYLNRCWSVISREDTRDVLGWCVTNRGLTICIRVLLEAAVERRPSYISRRAIFFFANFSHLYDVAERVVRNPNFKVDSCLRLTYQNQRVFAWSLPLHDAVAHHQLTIVELLIVDRGTAVDKLSVERISPLTIACHLIFPNMVTLLLRHGANPNALSTFSEKSEHFCKNDEASKPAAWDRHQPPNESRERAKSTVVRGSWLRTGDVS